MPEQARMMYRAPGSSLESCCFISDTEYLSGSDNGTVALWGMLKKKPIFLLKNEHSVTINGEFLFVSSLMQLNLNILFCFIAASDALKGLNSFNIFLKQKMVIMIMWSIITHAQQVLGSVQLLYVEVVILLHLELVMVLCI